MFSCELVCVFACLFVCLFVNKITQTYGQILMKFSGYV